MIVAAYYIERSHRYIPCWDVANTKKEALDKAKKWAIDSNCYVSVTEGYKVIAIFDENGERIK